MKKKEKHGASRITALTVFFVFLLMYPFLFPSAANAVTCTTTATNGSWIDYTIWDCGHVPFATDDAVVTGGADVVAGPMINSFYSLTIGGTAELVVGHDLICHNTVEIGGDGTVSFQDCSMSADPVYVNWGDGTPVEYGSVGDSFSHTYAVSNYGQSYYIITHSVSDGFNASTETIPVSVPLSPTGTLTVTTASPLSGVNVYAYQGNSMWQTITDSTGSATFTSLPTGQYTVYLYYPTGHGCSFVNGASYTVTADTTTSVDATSCY